MCERVCVSELERDSEQESERETERQRGGEAVTHIRASIDIHANSLMENGGV